VIDAVTEQVNTIFVADNTPQPYFVCTQNNNNIVSHKMGRNAGIAAAQNVGIQYFIEQSYDYVFFLDQDSIVDQNMLNTLLSTHKLLQQECINVGAVGPRSVDRQSNKKNIGLIKKGNAIFPHITEVTQLISSGSLVKIEALKQIGFMEEKLFIDNVDDEWCWRGTYKYGYRFFISEQTMLNHQFGIGDRFFIFRKIAISTPFRIYYLYRNYFWLLRRNYVPLYWKLSMGCKFFARLPYYSLCITPRAEYFKRICLGMRDGIFKNKIASKL
jgi:rhamnosyltransferase